MGMDSVEILMSVEEAFGIEIEDHEAEKIRPPADLIELVRAKIAVVQSPICLSHRAFNLLRRSLTRRLGIKRTVIAPNILLADLIRTPDRTDVLKGIAEDTGIGPLPELVRPGWMICSIFGGSIACAIAFLQLLSSSFAPPWVVSGATSILVGYPAVKMTRPFKTEFPKQIRSVGNLSRWIMAHKPGIANNTPVGWTREQVALRVRETVTDILGCSGAYREDARFIEDLTMD